MLNYIRLKELNPFCGERSGTVLFSASLGVTKPSVTYTTKRLRESGYITMDKDGLITLTDSGLAIAESMLERHRLLSGFLMALGVEEKVALRDACRIEHDISQQTFEAICRHVQSEKKQP